MSKKNISAKKDNGLDSLVSLVVWISFVLGSLAIGFILIDESVVISFIPEFISAMVGWIIVVLTIIGAILGLFSSFNKK